MSTLAWVLVVWLAGMTLLLGMVALGKRADSRASALFRTTASRRPTAASRRRSSLRAARNSAKDLKDGLAPAARSR